jgi:hypothetical protein
LGSLCLSHQSYEGLVRTAISKLVGFTYVQIGIAMVEIVFVEENLKDYIRWTQLNIFLQLWVLKRQLTEFHQNETGPILSTKSTRNWHASPSIYEVTLLMFKWPFWCLSDPLNYLSDPFDIYKWPFEVWSNFQLTREWHALTRTIWP